MKQVWLTNTLFIASLYAFRMLGLFMLIPVFTPYAKTLSSATSWSIGIALGCYGLSQGLLQIPFGLLSDRYGRKPLITLGLVLFILGSLWGAVTTSIYGMIFARSVQGAGAIGSVLMALLADLTPDAKRTKAMAVIGVTIACSFSLAMILSPLLTSHWGLSGIFYLTAGCGVLGLLVLHQCITIPMQRYKEQSGYGFQLKKALKNPALQRLNLSIFSQHLILTATFFAIPLLLHHQQEIGHVTQPWLFYLALILGAFILMIPFIMVEKATHLKLILLTAIAITGLTQLGLIFNYSNWLSLCGLLVLYMVGFNVLEANLPALISKQADTGNKGTAMGIYSSSQFLGIFAGGACAGFAYQIHSYEAIFLMNALITGLWFYIARKINIPSHT